MEPCLAEYIPVVQYVWYDDMRNSKPRIKTVSVSELVDMPVQGMTMQITNVRYLNAGVAKPKWREMRSVTKKDSLIYWYWKPYLHRDLGFSGSIEDAYGYPKIQLNLVDYNKLMKGK